MDSTTPSRSKMDSQLLLTGVGGQGILFATKLLAETARRLGLHVTGSETHGMSQRGGSVTSHLKLGDWSSPMVRPGAADVLIALEPNEAYRCLRFLRPEGKSTLFVNATEGTFPSERVRGMLRDADISLGVLDAAALAARLGSPVIVNLILIGFATAHQRFPFDADQVATSLAELSPPRFRDLNNEALRAGHELAVSLRRR